MSPSIWTRCAGSSRLRPLGGKAWRTVEAQHRVSTAKLVDSTEEQATLERLIEAAKPPLPRDREFAGLHFLFSTSFRYPPLAHGSRFATRHERSLWYGSRELPTALAEAAYYRLVFLEGTTAEIERLEVDLSAFRTPYRARRGVDLTRPPFLAFARAISSPSSYALSQQLGRDMREAGVEAFRYLSARDREGVNVGLFTPSAFAAGRPPALETWHCAATREEVRFTRKDLFARGSLSFPRSTFEVGGKLPAPAAC